MSGKELARYWLHCDFITIDNEKISKSLGNVYMLSDLRERGFMAMDYKMWVLSGHYLGTRNFTFESLEGARARRLNWRNRIAECYQGSINSVGAFDKILEAVSDNLNSAEAFKIIDNSVLSLSDWKKIDELFGLRLIEDSPEISDEFSALIDEREEARRNHDFARADEIRGRLIAEGFSVKDTPSGPIWQYI